MTLSDADILHVITGLAGGALAVLVAVIGWGLNRGIKGIDTKLTSFAEGLKDVDELVQVHAERLVRIETHLGFDVPPLPRPVPRRKTGEH